MRTVIALLFILILLVPSPADAQQRGDVHLRFSRNAEGMRLVLDSDEDTIRDSNTIVTLSSVKIEFSAPVRFSSQPGFPFDASLEGKLLTITLRNVTDAKVFKLSAPTRLVVDLKMEQDVQVQPPVAVTVPASPEAGAPENVPDPAGDEGRPAGVGPARSGSVVIDPGHGGFDSGLVSGETLEKDVNLEMSKVLGDLLTAEGRTVVLTRAVDEPLSLDDRILTASKAGPDIFLSVHSSFSDKAFVYISSLEDRNVDPVVRLYGLAFRQLRYLDQSRKLAEAMAEVIGEELKSVVVVRELPLPVLNAMAAPAVLVEYPSVKFVAYGKDALGDFAALIRKGLEEYER